MAAADSGPTTATPKLRASMTTVMSEAHRDFQYRSMLSLRSDRSLCIPVVRITCVIEVVHHSW